MARVNYVKHARQRYATVPVLDEAGEPRTVTVMKKRWHQDEDGLRTFELVPKLTKKGAPIVKRLTRQDRDHPLPMPRCEVCSTTIEPGQPYRWVQPKTGPNGGRKRFRCTACPTWRQWDLSNSLSARVAQVQDEYAFDGGQTAEEYRDRANEAADAIEELADERGESAENIAAGFGNETEQSMALQQDADDLRSWAEDLRNLDIDDEPEDDGSLEEEDYADAFEQWQLAADSTYEDALSASPV